MCKYGLFLNQLRVLRYKTKQHCHSTAPTNTAKKNGVVVGINTFNKNFTNRQCLGLDICAKGGNDFILSPEELRNLKPATTKEEFEGYYG